MRSTSHACPQFLHAGSTAHLVIQAHQENDGDTWLFSSSDFSTRVTSSAISKSPHVRASPTFLAKCTLTGSRYTFAPCSTNQTGMAISRPDVRPVTLISIWDMTTIRTFLGHLSR